MTPLTDAWLRGRVDAVARFHGWGGTGWRRLLSISFLAVSLVLALGAAAGVGLGWEAPSWAARIVVGAWALCWFVVHALRGYDEPLGPAHPAGDRSRAG